MIADHASAALHFSGGKDSLACLHMLRPHWDKITVMWLNTGAAFPETVQLMADVRAMVPHFLEVKSDQPANIAKYGSPVEVVPVRNTIWGQAIHPGKELRLQNYIECCHSNIWRPMQDATRALGATLVIRGQRNSESSRGPIKSGYVEDGVTYWFPLEDWSEDEVFGFLRAQGVTIPKHYEWTKTSLDCWSCTAYLYETKGRMDYMKDVHPVLWSLQSLRLREIHAAIKDELVHLENCLS